jgi:hypothetical protein
MSLLAAALLLLQDETTDAFRGWAPREGHRSRLKSEFTVSTWAKLSKDAASRPIKTERGQSFEATQDIVKVEDGALAKVRRAFVKATHRKNLWENPYGFQGATLVVAYPPDAPRVFAYEGGRAVALIEEEVLRDAFLDRQDDRPGRGGRGRSPLMPAAPLAAGGAAELSAKDVALLVGGDRFADTVDLEASKVTLTFKGVETRAGARMASLACLGTFPLRRFDELTLEKPIPARLTYTLEICVDGSRPDQQGSWVVEVKGVSPVRLPNGATVQLELDNRSETRYSQQTLTNE